MIRCATRGDIDSILFLEELLFADPFGRREINSLYSHPAAMPFVAECNDVVVGYMLATTDACSAEIVRVAVDPAFHRQGFGREMVERLAAAIGDDMSIEIKTGDLDTIRWLGKCGFMCVEDYPSSQVNIYLFRRGWRFSRAPSLKFRMQG